MHAFVPHAPASLIRFRTGHGRYCSRHRPRMGASSDDENSAKTPAPNEAIVESTPVLQPRPVRSADAPTAEETTTTDTPSVQARVQLQSSVLTAMKDYFGDDGREADDFCKRPTTQSGTPMFRVLIVGSGERELELAKSLSECECVMGVYYTPDIPLACDVRFAAYATSTGTASDDPAGLLRFARWALVDAVFVGPEFPGAVPSDIEAELANEAITVFPHDVSAAVADGALDTAVCLAPLCDDMPDSDAVIVGSEFGDNLASSSSQETFVENTGDSKIGTSK